MGYPRGFSASSPATGAMPPEMIFDYMGIKLDGARAAGASARIQWTITDSGATYALELRNSALIYTAGKTLDSPDAAVRTSKAALAGAVFGASTVAEAVADGDFDLDGEADAVVGLFALLEDFPFWFPIVQP